MSFTLKRPIVYPPLTGEEPQWFMNLWENINRGWAQGATATGSLVYASVNDSAAINNTAVETEFNKSYTIPANSLAIGTTITVMAFGTNTINAANNFDLYFRIGGTRIGGNAARPMNANGSWQIQAQAVVRSLGAAGNFQRGYSWHVASGEGGFAAANNMNDLTGTVALNTTTSLTAAISWKWQTANVNNSATMNALSVWIDGAGTTS